jgi:formylglycine-generating enzyme required for sulfatase activity
VPEAISYQGRALTTTGGLVGAGAPVTRTITFRIWDHPSNSLAANLIYSEQQLVTIAEGEFSVLIGTGVNNAGTPLGYSEAAKGPPTIKISDAFGGRSRYLGVTIDDGTAAADREIFPRQQMVSTAYAFRSKSTESLGSEITTAMIAAGAVSTDSIADNAITAAKIADGAIVTEKIADGAVDRSTISDGSISLAKLGGPSIPVGMARIPGGTFTMGNTMSADTDIGFASTVSVTLSEFWLGTHPVTYSEWLAVYHWATNNGYSFTNPGSGKFPNHPVQSVSWNDSVKWCNARSEKEGLTPVYYTDTAHTNIYRSGDEMLTNEMVKWVANGYRLPTEAEWERAARGGLAGQRFPWGDIHISHELANYKTSNDGRPRKAWDLGPSTAAAALGYHALGSVGGTDPATSAVGIFAPNGYGLYDMAGNVYEHCWDWLGTADGFGGAAYVGGNNPRGPSINNALVTRSRMGGSWADGTLSGGPYRATRGGAWGTPGLTSEQERLSQSPGDCRTAARSGSTTPTSITTNTGFRVARSGLSDGADSGLLALAEPVLSPMGGEYADPLIVTITSPDAASIIYTTDGSDPLKYQDSNGNSNATTAASPAQIPLSASGTVTLRARAIKSTRISSPTSATYELSKVALEEVVIDQVTVGDAGNAADPLTGFGAVDYEYKIAKNETTISQYATFLNAVARTDTYALYNTSMTESSINGISRSGIPGAYTYTVNPGSGNKPITYVNWFDAARFANWMHNGQPEGAQDASSTETGAYTLNGKTSGIVAKNSGAKVWIPSQDEWYKVAYYDPDKSGAGVGGYWLHANQSDVMTSNTIGVAGASNHTDLADEYAVYTGGTSWGITDVGAYGVNSESAYGTNDQAGNVGEWTDGVEGGTSRVTLGGTWYSWDTELRASSSFSEVPTQQNFLYGFRVAATTKNYDAIDGLIPLTAPVFSPLGGEYPSPLDVTITSPDGATLIYTTDGSDPLLSGNSNATSATSPTSVSLSGLGATTLRAHAVGTTTVSPPTTAVYELFEVPPAAPVFSPLGGEHRNPLDVTITSPDGAALIYTTDGSDPLLSGNSNATSVSSPAIVQLSALGATTLRAHAIGTTTVSLQTRAVYELFEKALEAVVIDQVTVGDAGNAADPLTGFGSVDYEYNIAKNETTISQYALFLNAVAKTDTYALYNAGMTGSFINGISRSGEPDAYTYTVNPGSGNKPITHVDWFDAARFANWMHNGQPEGAQDASSTETGAYTLNGQTSGIVAKNSGAKFWIPSRNEWYKAAYYDPDKSGAGVGGYWLHANQSDVMTSNTIGVAGASNHQDADGYAVWVGGTSWAITDVGAYGVNSESAYGTNDQAGNVMEWTDGVEGETSRVLLGGPWNSPENDLRASNPLITDLLLQSMLNGFRLASVF